MQNRIRLDRVGFLAGLAVSLMLAACICLGSQGLKYFDRAVLWYAVGSVLAAFAVGYRLAIWARRPSSRMYFRRGFQLLCQHGLNGSSRCPLHVSRFILPIRAWDKVRTEAIGRCVPPHPNPLPQDEGTPYSTPRQAERALLMEKRRPNLPLPWGVGRGEGKRTVVGPAASALGSKPSASLSLADTVAQNFIAQNFIRRRSLYRWIMHLCLSGGCALAFAITFPLVFGWVHFESVAGNAEIYRVAVFGFAAGSFNVHGATAFVAFNLLNFSAIIVAVGLMMAAFRRLTDPGERATQKFTEDILPLLLIFAVTATGLMLTVSYKFLAGQGHSLIAVAHTLSVIALLGSIPFGKLFHLFQRACSLCVSLYKKAGAAGPRMRCARCREDFASEMHVADLKTVLDQLGFNYRFATPRGEVHYQDICPPCRRRLLALNQGQTLGR